jgi:hypothetical protein
MLFMCIYLSSALSLAHSFQEVVAKMSDSGDGQRGLGGEQMATKESSIHALEYSKIGHLTHVRIFKCTLTTRGNDVS